MASFNIRLNKKNIVPTVFYLAKLFILAVSVNFLIIPLIFETFTFFGEVRSFWQIIITVVLTAYLSDVIELRIKGRDWF